jgi:phenylacetate-coenzyme A ligase PaaK-like adenylate-forming protein
MYPTIIPRVLYHRRRLRRRETWSRPELLSYQARALAELRGFALDRSTFYRRFHAGLAHRPLSELPVLTKRDLMGHYDEISTDPRVRLADLERYLARPDDGRLFAGRYWVSGTSGSSGQRAIMANDSREWATLIASYARANEWAGIRPTLRNKARMAVVSSTTAWHSSARAGATIQSPLVETIRLDAGTPLENIIGALNAFRPGVLVAYASMIRVLAEEQLRGRLRIAPRAVNSSSEVLTPEGRALAERAWGVPPFNVYAATETGGIAAECERHQGMHLFEDVVISEVVDAEGRPVAPGETGDRMLVTVLWSRTLPLIRYELTDRVRLSDGTCACGRPFALISGIEGRTDDVLELPGEHGGLIRVHPVALHRALDLLPAAGWQVREEESGLRILIAAPAPGFDASTVAQSVREALATAGAAPIGLSIEVVDSIAAGASGKRPLVVAKQIPRGARESAPVSTATPSSPRVA